MSLQSVPNPLIVPNLIGGEWTSAIILTFGANLSFFEATILRQLSTVPLRVVLADARQLDSTLSTASAVGARHRMLNRAYLVSPLRHPRAAHAKAVLLLGPKAGRLIVGSGNLGHDGYGTAGELWHVFAYQDELLTKHLPEFVAIRDLIDQMATHKVIDPPVIDFLQTVWSKAPWLPPTSVGSSTVRHNLEVPLIAQLAEAVDWPVTEMTVHAPFHDPDSDALAALISRFRPQSVRVLLSRATSVDTTKLAAVMASAPRSTWFLVEVAEEESTYIHAKWVHLAGVDSEVLLTGSANLSRSALMNNHRSGNIEIGVITHGTPGEFSPLYRHLKLLPIADVSALRLSYQPIAEEDSHSRLPKVIWSRLDDKKLTLAFDRVLGAMQGGIRVFVSTEEITPRSIDVDGQYVTIFLTRVDAALAAEGGPIQVQFGDTDADASETWPYQLAAIRGRLDRARERDMLPLIAALPDRDQDLLALLRDLEETLVFDSVSTWRLANPSAYIVIPPDDANESVRWEDLDWARVRRDSRYTGYMLQTERHAPPSDIQVILAAIGGRLGALGLARLTEFTDEEASLAHEGEPVIAADDELDEDAHEEELQKLARTISTRTRMAFNRFVTRYAAAVRDESFVKELGSVVSASNAAIFNHLLVALKDRDALDIAKATDAQIALWTHLWGAPSRPGLLGMLHDDERDAVDAVLTDAGVRQTTLKALAGMSVLEMPPSQRADLRTLTQHLIDEESFGLDRDLIESVSTISGLGSDVLRALANIASPDTSKDVADLVLRPFGLGSSAAEWRTAEVSRAKAGGLFPTRVNVLTVRESVLGLTHETVKQSVERFAIAAHLAGMPNDYLRIRFEGNGSAVGFWDSDASIGVAMVGGDDQEFGSLNLPRPSWHLRLEQLEQGAPQAQP